MKANKYGNIDTETNMNQCPICKADLTNIWEHRHFKLMKGNLKHYFKFILSLL